MRTASTAANPCQEDSSEFYLITGSIYTDQRGTVVSPMVAAARRRRSSATPDTVRLYRTVDEVLKLKNFEKDASFQLSSYQIKKDAQDHILTYKLKIKEQAPSESQCSLRHIHKKKLRNEVYELKTKDKA
ncbi:hypothetical protein Tco_1296945 [Tanacetum coccineum]